MTTDVVLKFEIVEGQTPNAENIAKALLAWVEMMKVAGALLDPGSELEVGLTGVESGSDIFKLALRRAETFASELKTGMSEYPLVTKAVLTLAGAVATTVITVAVTNAIQSDTKLDKEQMAVFEDQRRLLQESTALLREQNRFYGILHEEPAVERFDVLSARQDVVLYSVPQQDFAAASGLWSSQEQALPEPVTENRTVTWEVVLVKAVLIAEPRRWHFVRDGLEFSARMEDPRFLSAIRDRTLHIELAEGIRMRIVVKYKETREGEAWLPVKGSYRVAEVLDPLPPAPITSLFSGPGAP